MWRKTRLSPSTDARTSDGTISTSGPSALLLPALLPKSTLRTDRPDIRNMSSPDHPQIGFESLTEATVCTGTVTTPNSGIDAYPFWITIFSLPGIIGDLVAPPRQSLPGGGGFVTWQSAAISQGAVG